jgi:hypothetical protein
MAAKNRRTLHLLVTCSLDDSRAEIAQQVAKNIVDCGVRRPELLEQLIAKNP